MNVNKILIFITIIILLLLSANFMWGRSNTMLETPKYKLIKKFKSFEIREYEAMIIARTLVSSDYSDAADMGFQRVANYIFGDNDKDMKIAMTAPVLLNSPVDAEDEYKYLL